MPTIGWFEILIIVTVAIIIVGPKDFPLMVKKVGSWIGSIKRYVNNVQSEVSSITEDTIEKSINDNNDVNTAMAVPIHNMEAMRQVLSGEFDFQTIRPRTVSTYFDVSRLERLTTPKGTSRRLAKVRARYVLPLPVGPISKTLLFSISTPSKSSDEKRL